MASVVRGSPKNMDVGKNLPIAVTAALLPRIQRSDMEGKLERDNL